MEDFSLWTPEPRLDCCLAVLHGVPSESCKQTPIKSLAIHQPLAGASYLADSKINEYCLATMLCKTQCVFAGLTASLELEVDEDEGDSGEDEGEERSEGDGEEELEDVLL